MASKSTTGTLHRRLMMAGKEEYGPNHIKNYVLGEMKPYGNYPQSLLDTFKQKSLIGPKAHLKTEDAHAGVLQIDPGTDYAAQHPRLAGGLLHHPGRRRLHLGRRLLRLWTRHHYLRRTLHLPRHENHQRRAPAGLDIQLGPGRRPKRIRRRRKTNLTKLEK